MEFTKQSNIPFIEKTSKIYTYIGHPRLDYLRSIKSLDQLKGFEVVDYLGDGWGKEHLGHLNVTWLSEMKDCLTFLSLKRADVFVQASIVANYNIKQLGLKDKLIELNGVITETPHHLLVSKTSRFLGILEDADDAIIHMKSDGTLQKLIDRYK